MSILSGYKKVKDRILTSSGYQLISRWTSTNTVEADDGKTLQTKVGAVNGIVKDYASLSTTTDSSFAASATAVKEGFDAVNSNLKKVAYPYTNYTDVTLRGYISKLQNDPEGKKRYVIFVPTYQSPYSRYGVKTIKSLVIQGVAIIRQNATNQTGYTVSNAVQDYQCIRLSVLTDNDISGYLCDCTFDFYEN